MDAGHAGFAALPTRESRSRSGRTAQTKLAPKALAAAQKGAKVAAILVEQAGIATEAGIGVGSSYASLEQAHGPIEVITYPELFDSKIACDASSKSNAERALFARQLRDRKATRRRQPRVLARAGLRL